jgi:hypothetical protein
MGCFNSVDVGDFFLELATSYNRLDGLHTPAQELLAGAAVSLAEHAPAGILIQASGGKGLATYTPWVGFSILMSLTRRSEAFTSSISCLRTWRSLLSR